MAKINPRVDFAFKILFGSEGNTDILLPFVNSVLSLPNPLVELTLLNPYNLKTYATDKTTILDIKARDDSGHLYNIEMQMNNEVNYSKRALYYWSKLYSQQLIQGRDFSTLKKTISIHILNFDYFDEPDYHNIYHILNAKTQKRAFEDLELHFIELKKFHKDLSHLTTALDRWTTFLSRAEQWERNFIPEELRSDPAIAKAAYALDILSLDDQELEIYEAQVKWQRHMSGVLQKVQEVSTEEGRKEGREEGRKVGREEGREEGRKEGEILGIEKVALNLMSKGLLSIEEISATTGLAKEALLALQSSEQLA